MCGVMIAQVKGDESMVIWNVNIIPDIVLVFLCLRFQELAERME